jgi:predicted nucleotidyltransferase
METLKKDICSGLDDCLKQTDFSTIYLFGSLIHKDGDQFDCQISDIDTICPFQPGSNYLDRWRAVKKAEAPTSHLNLSFLKVLQRKDASEPIVSVVPVSDFELELGIHKDKSAQFFSHNKFFDISNEKTAPIGNEYKTGSPELEGAIDAVRETQKYRNKVLAISPSGIRFCREYDGPDVLPKALLRCAAQVRWAREINAKSDEQRFDVNEGLIYILQLLMARRNESQDVDDLLQHVTIRMGGRGKSAPLSQFDQLLLWEILADDCFALVKKEDEQNKPIQRTRIPKKIRAAAFHRAGYCCSYPGCSTPLGEDGIGEIARIRSLSKVSARHDSTLNQDDLDVLENLVVLCPTHHRLIDSKPEEYTSEVIQSWNNSLRNQDVDALPFSSKDLFTILRIILNLIT